MATCSDEMTLQKLAHPQVAAYLPQMEELLREALSASQSAKRYDLEREVASTLNMAERHPDYVTVVATSGKRILGMVVASIQSDTNCAFVLWIAVAADVQRQGIGNRLIDHLQDTTRVNMVTGYVNLEDPVAAGFWNSRGWRRVHPPPQRVLMGTRL